MAPQGLREMGSTPTFLKGICALGYSRVSPDARHMISGSRLAFHTAIYLQLRHTAVVEMALPQFDF